MVDYIETWANQNNYDARKLQEKCIQFEVMLAMN